MGEKNKCYFEIIIIYKRPVFMFPDIYFCVITKM